jgi:hypothetical protein
MAQIRADGEKQASTSGCEHDEHASVTEIPRDAPSPPIQMRGHVSSLVANQPASFSFGESFPCISKLESLFFVREHRYPLVVCTAVHLSYGQASVDANVILGAGSLLEPQKAPNPAEANANPVSFQREL